MFLNTAAEKPYIVVHKIVTIKLSNQRRVVKYRNLQIFNLISLKIHGTKK